MSGRHAALVVLAVLLTTAWIALHLDASAFDPGLHDCPTPYKQAFANKCAARMVVKAMQRRGKYGKGRPLPQTPHECPCGSVHLADPRRARGYERAKS